jgi:hypothetical protein
LLQRGSTTRLKLAARRREFARHVIPRVNMLRLAMLTLPFSFSDALPLAV